MSHTVKANQPLHVSRSAAAQRINHSLRKQHEQQKLCKHKRTTVLESGFGPAIGCLDCGNVLGFGAPPKVG